jgi:hypothetical protein
MSGALLVRGFIKRMSNVPGRTKRHERGDPSGRFGLYPGQDACVLLERERRRLVAEILADGLDPDAGPEREARVRMAEAVQPDPAEAGIGDIRSNDWLNRCGWIGPPLCLATTGPRPGSQRPARHAPGPAVHGARAAVERSRHRVRRPGCCIEHARRLIPEHEITDEIESILALTSNS